MLSPSMKAISLSSENDISFIVLDSIDKTITIEKSDIVALFKKTEEK